MTTEPRRPVRTAVVHLPDDCGLAMITLLVTVMLVTMISLSLVGFMNTDMTHASIQYAVARSFYIAQAGLEEAKVQIAAAADPSTYRTPAEGVTEAYGSGQFTYWVDPGTGLQTACGVGLTTLEAAGQVAYLNRTFSTRVRACGVAGAPFLTALFGVARLQFQGAASRLYLAPYPVGTPGGGGSLGSFTEVNFSDNGVRLNALDEVGADTLTLRDGRVIDYTLFGFPTPPRYDPTPMTDPTPWILSAFGDIIKAQSTTGLITNPCGTPYACLTAGNGITDIKRMADLREANYMQHAYMRSIRQETLPRLALDPEAFRARAAQNTANSAMNRKLGFPRGDAVYASQQFYQIVTYLAADPRRSLEGTVYVDDSFLFTRSVNLGNVTLAVRGDLVIGDKVGVTIRHDLSTGSGRRMPGIVVFGSRAAGERPVEDCEGEPVSGSGRFILCDESTLAVDGLVYTQDGMAVHSRASVDQVGAMYHDTRGTAAPSFSERDATVVLRFDPLALSAFGSGIAILSWQQLQGSGAGSAPAAPLAIASPTPALAAAAPPAAPAPAAAAVLLPSGSAAVPSLTAVVPPSPAGGAQPAAASEGPAGGHEFRVQAGAFRERKYADDLVRQLRAHGFPGVVVEGPLLHVSVGPPMSRTAAERLAANLRVSGFETTLSPAR